MRINREKLVKIAVNGQVDHPRMKGFRVGYDGKGRMPIGTGGITYSHAVGDSCMGLAGDHVEPGISLANPSNGENHALETFACVGNEARIINGPQKGKKGYVSGTHGGIDHTMICFDKDILEEMDGNETILVKAYGQGLKLLDHEDIYVMNIDPDLLEAMPIQETDNGITFPVVTSVPAFLMGSGLGSNTMMEGDYDIMTQDKEANEKYGLNDLRFGDFVAILDHYNEYGPYYLKGSISVGVIVHSDSYTSGHGPGVCVIATSKNGSIRPVIDKDANLKTYMKQIQRRG